MKILIVTQYFWPENFRINDLALGLRQQGHEITVFTGKPNYPKGSFYKGYSFFKKSKEVWNGITIIRTPLIARGEGRGLGLVLNFISFAFFGALNALFIKVKTDVIFVYEPSPVTVGIPAIIFKKKTKAPIAFWVQDVWPQMLHIAGGINNKFILNSADKLTKWIYNKSDKVLVQSKAFIGYVENQIKDKEKIIYFPNSSESFYKPVIKSEKYKSYFTSKYNLVFAGNIGESQGFNTLLEAAALVREQNPDIGWVIIGDGRMRPFVEEKIKTLKLENNFRLIGSFPPETMPEFFAHADAMILSLKNDMILSLTIPSKLQSYMACGKPIIGSLSGEGGRIIIESNSGYAAPGEDKVELANKIIEFFQLPEEIRKLFGQNALEYYNREFDRDTQITNLLNLFKSL